MTLNSFNKNIPLHIDSFPLVSQQSLHAVQVLLPAVFINLLSQVKILLSWTC